MVDLAFSLPLHLNPQSAIKGSLETEGQFGSRVGPNIERERTHSRQRSPIRAYTIICPMALALHCSAAAVDASGFRLKLLFILHYRLALEAMNKALLALNPEAGTNPTDLLLKPEEMVAVTENFFPNGTVRSPPPPSLSQLSKSNAHTCSSHVMLPFRV